MKIIPKRYKEVSWSQKESPRVSAQGDVIIRPDLEQQLHPFSGRLKTCRDVIKPLVNDRPRSSGANGGEYQRCPDCHPGKLGLGSLLS